MRGIVIVNPVVAVDNNNNKQVRMSAPFQVGDKVRAYHKMETWLPG